MAGDPKFYWPRFLWSPAWSLALSPHFYASGTLSEKPAQLSFSTLWRHLCDD